MFSYNRVCLQTVSELYGKGKTPSLVPSENSELSQKALIVHNLLCQVSESQLCVLRTSCGHAVLCCSKYLERTTKKTSTPTKGFATCQKQG